MFLLFVSFILSLLFVGFLFVSVVCGLCFVSVVRGFVLFLLFVVVFFFF